MSPHDLRSSDNQHANIGQECTPFVYHDLVPAACSLAPLNTGFEDPVVARRAMADNRAAHRYMRLWTDEYASRADADLVVDGDILPGHTDVLSMSPEFGQALLGAGDIAQPPQPRGDSSRDVSGHVGTFTDTNGAGDVLGEQLVCRHCGRKRIEGALVG